MKWIPLRVRAMWNAFPPAPEDAALRRWRWWSVGLCTGTAIGIACVDHIEAVASWLVLPVGGMVFAASAVTARYWRLKHSRDCAHQAGLDEVVHACAGEEGL